MTKCKWGANPEYLQNSTAWLCMYKIPLALVAKVGRIDYHNMEINEFLCTPVNCRCYGENQSGG